MCLVLGDWKIYSKYIMWGIKLKGFISQADLSYSQGYDDNGKDDKDDNDKDDMNNKDYVNDKDDINARTIYYKYMMCGFKLKDFRQAGLRCSKGWDNLS